MKRGAVLGSLAEWEGTVGVSTAKVHCLRVWNYQRISKRHSIQKDNNNQNNKSLSPPLCHPLLGPLRPSALTKDLWVIFQLEGGKDLALQTADSKDSHGFLVGSCRRCRREAPHYVVPLFSIQYILSFLFLCVCARATDGGLPLCAKEVIRHLNAISKPLCYKK